MLTTGEVTESEIEVFDPTLVSFVTTSPADGLLSEAITTTLSADASSRGELFARLLAGIESQMQQLPQDRPWTFEAFTGTDGSSIFRGQTGRAIVVDPAGVLWRGRSYEDFDIEYSIAGSTCTIVSITPRYGEMRPYSLDRRG